MDTQAGHDVDDSEMKMSVLIKPVASEVFTDVEGGVGSQTAETAIESAQQNSSPIVVNRPECTLPCLINTRYLESFTRWAALYHRAFTCGHQHP